MAAFSEVNLGFLSALQRLRVQGLDCKIEGSCGLGFRLRCLGFLGAQAFRKLPRGCSSSSYRYEYSYHDYYHYYYYDDDDYYY